MFYGSPGRTNGVGQILPGTKGNNSNQQHSPSQLNQMQADQTRDDGSLVCTDGRCLLWAALALARLDDKLPSRDDVASNPNNGFARRLRDTIDNMTRAFIDPGSEAMSGWAALDPEFARFCVSELLRTATNYYQHLDDEFLQLHAIFRAFSVKMTSMDFDHPVEGFSTFGMVSAIAGQMSQLIAPKMAETFITVNTMSENMTDEQLEPAISCYAFEQAGVMSRVIGSFIRVEFARMMPGSLSTHADAMVRVVEDALEGQVHTALKYLLWCLNPRAGGTIDPEDEVTKLDLQVFYRHVAEFFSYASPLFSHRWVSPDDDSMYNSESDLDDEPRWQEYELVDLVDVLEGPENLSVDEVSVVVPGYIEASCIICHDCYRSMRRVNVCRHMYCEACLDGQLHTYHASRYKCAACRADFLSE